MGNENSRQQKNSENKVKVFDDENQILLGSDVKAHINESVKESTERTAIQYAAFVFSGSALFILGIIFNAIWGLNERSSKNEGRIMEFSSYVETLKSQNRTLESENEFLKKQRSCLIENKKATMECLYGN